MEYTIDKPLRLVTLFSGYDSQALAMKRLCADFPPLAFDLVAWCEIEASAIKAHNALFPQWSERNLGDITKVRGDEVPDCDLITWSYPCTDLSQAGKQAGMSEGSGTRSSLAWDAIRIFKVKRPKYLLMENVPALVSSKFIKDFHQVLLALENIGYKNFTELLNAKDYGTPQNRLRTFCVSILRTPDNPEPRFDFPAPFKLDKCLEDVLQEDVDESLFLRDEMLARFCVKSVEQEGLITPNNQSDE